MKRIILTSLLSVALCAASVTSIAAGPDRPGPSISQELQKELNKHIVAPAFADNDEMLGEVTASFVVDRNGELEVKEVLSENKELQDYVERKLQKVKVSKNEGGFWKTTSVRFVFRRQG